MVEIEVVGLFEEPELPLFLCLEDGGRAASEAAVVDSGDCWIVVSEFLVDFGV